MAAFTGGRTVPSARYRLRQFVPALASHGINVAEYWPRLGCYPPRNALARPVWAAGIVAERLVQVAASRRADVVFLQREMVSTLATVEGLTRRPRIVDIDDAIHLLRGGRAARHLAALADRVVVGNAWLAEVWRAWNPAVEIVPTVVDPTLYPLAPPPERPVLGWIGTSGNLGSLEALAEPLALVARRFPGLTLAVCCDRAPRLAGVPVRFVPWRPDIEYDFLQEISVGLMPLEDTLWARGKCSFKMLQYLAAGRPCVVSPIGMNADILAQAEVGLPAATPDQWAEALSALLADPDGAHRLGRQGRELVDSSYSLDRWAPHLARIVSELI